MRHTGPEEAGDDCVRRKLFSLAPALSLLLCVAAVGLGVRSFWTGDGVSLGVRDLGDNAFEDRYLFSARGTLGYRMWRFDQLEVPADPSAVSSAGSTTTLEVFSYHYATRPPSPWFRSPDPGALLAPVSGPGVSPQPGRRNIDLSALGFVIRRLDTLDSFTPSPYPQVVSHEADRIVGIPHWLIVVLAAAAPIAWLRRARIQRRLAKGLCRNCGYDLRATPDRCPECGRPVRTTIHK
jgi:hypothetical protein